MALDYCMLPSSDVYRNVFETACDGLIINDRETGRVVEANLAAFAMHGYLREEFVGLHPTAYLHPDSQRPFTTDAESARPGNILEGLAIHVRRDKSPFYAEARRTAITFQDRPCLLSVVRDVGRRVQAEQLLRQRLEARAHE
jgi:PAS domain S-box-containing protein